MGTSHVKKKDTNNDTTIGKLHGSWNEALTDAEKRARGGTEAGDGLESCSSRLSGENS